MFARTARLTLRPGWPEDAAQLTRAIAHREVVEKLSRVPWPYSEAEAQGWLARGPADRDVALLILSHEGDYPRLVGGGGLHADGTGAWEIAYWLTPDAWGRGYATEAGHALTGMARHALGLGRLTARHWLDNPASGRVLDKLGFRRTGTGEMPCLARGGTALPCATYALDLAAPPALAEAA